MRCINKFIIFLCNKYYFFIFLVLVYWIEDGYKNLFDDVFNWMIFEVVELFEICLFILLF